MEELDLDFAYALGQVPAGWLGDRFGPRSMLCVFLVLWSVFTAATGVANGFVTLLLARVGFGFAQAGAYPTSGALLKRWIPFSHRATASGIVVFGGRMGGAIAPLLTALILAHLGNWREVLIAYALLGVGLAWLLWVVVRDRPEEHPWCNRAECELIQKELPNGEPARDHLSRSFSFLPILKNTSMWLNCLSQFGTNMGWAFFITLLPKYLSEVKHVESVAGGKMASVVLVMGMTGMLLGGWLTDWTTRRMGLRGDLPSGWNRNPRNFCQTIRGRP